MTAEIAILNRSAVALAADSAVTISVGKGQKIYNTVNKLFTLSKFRPVGIMIYGAADFMGIPWESIIKEHRREIGKTEHATLQEYLDAFISWLRSNTQLFPEALQHQFLANGIREYFEQVRDEIEKRVSAAINAKGPIGESDVGHIVSDLIAEQRAKWQRFPRLDTVGAEFEADFAQRHRERIDQIRSSVFENLAVSEASAAELVAIVADGFCRDRFGEATSGVVIAGFGANEIFPSLIHCVLEGLIDSALKWKQIETAVINHENHATIVPIAQREMVDTFLSGVDPGYDETLRKALTQLLATSADELLQAIPPSAFPNRDGIKAMLRKKIPEIVASFSQKMTDYSEERHIAPIINAVAALPKDELAAMAESLVNLTSFKRRISTDSETVGGEIDVAVISKGDGFIWIKRKHYFDVGRNPQFVANYYADD